MITSISTTITFSSRVSSMSLRSSLVGKPRSQASTSGWRSPGYLSKEDHHWQLFWKPMLQLCNWRCCKYWNIFQWSEANLNWVLFRCGWHLFCVKYFSSSIQFVVFQICFESFISFTCCIIFFTTFDAVKKYLIDMFELLTCWISLHRRQGWDVGGHF